MNRHQLNARQNLLSHSSPGPVSDFVERSSPKLTFSNVDGARDRTTKLNLTIEVILDVHFRLDSLRNFETLIVNIKQSHILVQQVVAFQSY